MSRFWRRGFKLCRLLQSPRTERHHLGKKRGSRGRSDSWEDWLGGPSIPAGSARRPVWRELWAGRRDVGRGRSARRGAQRYPRPLLPAPPPSCLPSSAAQGLLGRGSGSRLPGVQPGLAAILGSRRGSVFLLSHRCLWPSLRKKRVHTGRPLGPPGVLESPLV